MSLPNYIPKWPRRAYLGPAGDAQAKREAARKKSAAGKPKTRLAAHQTLGKPLSYKNALKLNETTRNDAVFVNSNGWYSPKDIARVHKAVRRVSPAKAKRDRIYNARVRVWLTELGNTFCHCCIARNEAARPNPATQCHHRNGRLGSLLMAERFWIPVCSDCHEWIHNREPELAREIGMLAPKGTWNNQPKDL